MRHAPAFLLLTSIPFALLPAQRGGGGGGRGEMAPPKLEHFTFTTHALKSEKVKNGEASYDLYLPKEYADEANKDVKYPVIVWLHGFGGPGEFLGGGGAKVLDTLRGENKIPPVAMVVLRTSGRRTTYLNGESGGDTEDLIAGDLVTQLESTHRVGGDRTKRALMGVSMGGMGALKIAMRHPEQFGVVAVHSAAILPADPADLPDDYKGMVQRSIERGGLDKVLGNPIDKAKWAEQMPLGLVASRKPEEWKDLLIYFDAGDADRYGFCPPNEQLDKAMTEKGIRHLFRKIAGGGHAWSSPSMRECLAVSLQFVGAAFAGKDPFEAVAAATKPAPTEPKPEAPKPQEKGDGAIK